MCGSTLFHYTVSPSIVAFSTTRISPFYPSFEEIRQMGNYAAFNVTSYCHDRPERVRNNRTWLCKQLGITEDRLIMPHQEHTNKSVPITPDFFLKDDNEKQTFLQSVDGLFTQMPNVCIGVSTADCVPLLFFDEENHTIAAVHAGWRGTVERIAQHTLWEIKKLYNVDTQAIHAIIGPSISAEAFEVGDEVVEQFLAEGFPKQIITYPNGKNAKAHIDLWVANVWLLEQCGINLANIFTCGICTFHHADTFFSARRLGIDSGRIFTGIMLRSL